MAEIYKGYSLNEYLETSWYGRENALFKAILDLLPDSGEVLVTDEHLHCKLVASDRSVDPAVACDTDGYLIVGNGLAKADTLLHVWDGSAGSVSAHANAVAVLEGSSNVALQFLAPSNSLERILFGDNNDAAAGIIEYNHNAPRMRLLAEGVQAILIDDDGYVLINQSETLSAARSPLHVAAGVSGVTVTLPGTLVTIEHNDTCYLTLTTPNTVTGGILFADPQNLAAGRVLYNHSTDTMEFWAADMLQLSLVSSGLVVYNGRSIKAGGSAGLRLEDDGGNGITITDGGDLQIDLGKDVRWGKTLIGMATVYNNLWLRVKVNTGSGDQTAYIPITTDAPNAY